MNLNRDTLEDFMRQTDQLGGPGTPECRQFWEGLLYTPSVPLDAQDDPRSLAYRAQQWALYREITGHDYTDSRDEMTPGVPIERLLQAPNAYDQPDPSEYAKHCIAMAILVQRLALPRGARLLELGSGWGFTQEFLASCGYDTIGIEINPDFVAASNGRLKRLGFGERVVQGSFETIACRSLGRFDAVISYEALHHAVDVERVLAGCVKLLKPGGRIALAAEPFNNYYQTWGLRLDPYSIYSIRKFGWFESGWSIEYIAYILNKCGLEACFIELNTNELTRYMIGTLSDRRRPYQLGMWQPAVAAGWWAGWDYCSSKGRSQLLLSPPADAGGMRINASNFSTRDLVVSLTLADHERCYSVPPGATELHFDIPPSRHDEELALAITSDTFRPVELGINTDQRELGIHFETIEWLR